MNGRIYEDSYGTTELQQHLPDEAGYESVAIVHIHPSNLSTCRTKLHAFLKDIGADLGITIEKAE